MGIKGDKWGKIQITGNEICPEVAFDRIALEGRDRLLFVSLIADQMHVKQIRSILTCGLKCTIIASGVRVGVGDSEPSWNSFVPGRITADPDGYNLYSYKLGYNMVHAMFVTKRQGFMKTITEESLWRELNGPRYTTPVLREWVPYLGERMRGDGRLDDAKCYNCDCGMLYSSNKHLDETVSEGLQQRMIEIPR